MMADRIPITYGEFYDVPRMIEFRFEEKWFFLRSYFDEVNDDYTDYYDVYLLPFRSEDEIRADPYYWMRLDCSTCLGQITIAEVGFDETRRRSINAQAFDAWLSARGHSPTA